MRMKKALKAMLAATACACVLTMPLIVILLISANAT